MDPDLTIVLLGNSGVGKSASGNAILGRPAFESKRSFSPVTKIISKQTETLFGKRISVVDTPGVFGLEGEIQTYCQKLLQSNRPCLFLVVIKMDRFTIEQKNAVEAAIRVIGDQFNSCYLLFTTGNDNMTLDEFFNSGPDLPLKPFVEKFKGRHHVFNIKDGGQEQVRELLEKSGHPINDAHPKTARRIVLLGLPGAGKSASGNTILGSDQFKSDCCFDPVTTKAVSKSAIVEGCDVTVVDTPGFTDKDLTPEQLFKGIMQSLVKACPGPHAFVFVVRLGRITPADIRMFEHLPKVFDSEVCSAHQYSMILFTHGNGLKGRSIDDLIHSKSKNAQHVSELLSMCGDRYCVFDNSHKKSREQVRNLLNKIDEMVEGNDGQHFTNEMFNMAAGLKNEESNLSGQTVRSVEPVRSGETVRSVETVRSGEPVPPGVTASETYASDELDEIIWEKISNYVHDHAFEIFLTVAGLILGGVGGAVVGTKIAVKVWGAAKYVKLVGGVVGFAVGGTVGGAAGLELANSKDSDKTKKNK